MIWCSCKFKFTNHSPYSAFTHTYWNVRQWIFHLLVYNTETLNIANWIEVCKRTSKFKQEKNYQKWNIIILERVLYLYELKWLCFAFDNRCFAFIDSIENVDIFIQKINKIKKIKRKSSFPAFCVQCTLIGIFEIND